MAAISFPALSGRVVDNAHMLSDGTVQSLTQLLAEYENGTTNQVVVVTVPDLQAGTIEDYGYQLGRHWQIGQKGKNNGALLIVAPKEHKVRIEVGYGLEPLLTDAASSQIVQQVILPDFRAGQMEKGVIDGTQAMLDVLGGKPVVAAPEQQDSSGDLFALIFLAGLLLLMAIRFPAATAYLLLNMSSSRISGSRYGGYNSGSGGSSFGGGFSGGGGSFGGGGSTGSW